MSEAINIGARPATRPPLRSAAALILAVLVLFGLASGGLPPPERAITRPLAPLDVQQATRPASAGLVAEPSARRAIATARSPAAAGTLAPIPAEWAPKHQDADLRRTRHRTGIEIRGPPAGRSV
ncbi:MAG: hypothetical protein ABW360_08400 [Phenylobacterium sp.]